MHGREAEAVGADHFGHLLHDAVGPLEHLLQFFVLACVQVLLELTPLAL
jgi:hypothetical protein